MNTLSRAVTNSLSALTLSALVLGMAGSGFVPVAYAATPVSVTIEKYIDGAQATSVTANSADFPMMATYTIAGTPGSNSYALSASGFNGDPTPYQAITSGLNSGDDFATNEDTTGSVVGASCSAGAPFALVGYTTGDTLTEAQAATPTATEPTFVGLTNDKFVIVWNSTCPGPTPATEVVQINKFIDGAQATALSASSSSFAMSATWNDPSGIGAGTGSYTLDATQAPAYQTQTVAMQNGADYATNEVTGDAVVGASCSIGQPYTLAGYTTGTTFAAAAAGTPTMTAPAFTNLSSNEFVIVWNTTCASSTGTGTISGNSSGGTSPQGSLAVTSVTTVNSSATADGTFQNGWKYLFHITVPTNETHLAMKFADWFDASASSTIAVANNVRISSVQADNANTTVLITAANTYSSPSLHITGDLDAATPGLQVDVLVEAAVPANSVNGSYATDYGVQTLP